MIEPVLDAVLRAPDTFGSRGEARGALVTAGLAPELADWLLLNLEAAADRYRWRVDRRALAALHARSAREDLWPVVEGPRQWSLRCVRGAASPYVNERDAQRLQAAGCPVVTIDGAGHFLHAERPREVVDAVAAGRAGAGPPAGDNGQPRPRDSAAASRPARARAPPSPAPPALHRGSRTCRARAGRRRAPARSPRRRRPDPARCPAA
ncbi:MAG: alpha/beta fold hydrolase [Candidatus Rokuibacteriota bacterium]|nr:MAG: alpha/beta fold hydrolase [Candidatus Rokubacteria bacterium]